MPKLCEYNNCRERASYGIKRNIPIRCKSHKENMKLASMICFCGKSQPYFNNAGETIPLYCSKCKTDEMVDVKNKKCFCGKTQPNFNNAGETIPLYCSKCKTDEMVDVKNKKCVCGKSQPYFNNAGETIPLYCSKCKTDEMVDVKNKKCFCGKTRPTYNNEGDTKALYCVKCKTDTMIDVKHKKCLCGKSIPTYNNEGDTKALYCVKCKSDTMVDVLNKKCFCGKSRPTYNNEGDTKALYCVKCKSDTMVDVINQKCVCGNSQPVYNIEGEIKALYCSKCKTDEMVDVKNKKCLGFINNGITENCPYERYGNPKYKNYCTECFKRNFPLDTLTFQIRSKTKEIAVRDFINENFNGFQHNKPLQTGHCDCTMRRSIDHRKLIGNTLLAIETDENQHKSYDKMDEEIRYDDLYMAHSGKWIYIRFNPDKYIDKKGIRKNPMIYTRLEKLKNEIEKQIKRIENEENIDLVERIYMYYDGYN
jgi:uncharacterized protein YcfL